MKYCINCGNELRENAKFCEKCGAPRYNENTATINNNVQNKKENNNTKIVIIVLVSVISVYALLGTIIGISFYNIYKVIENNEYIPSVEEYDKELSVENFSIKYPSDEWTYFSGLDDNEKAIMYENSTIKISKDITDQNISNNDLEKQIVEEYKKKNYTTYSSELKKYNGKNWHEVTFQNNKMTIIIIFRIENATIYKLEYSSLNYEYYDEIYELINMFNTLQITDYVDEES